MSKGFLIRLKNEDHDRLKEFASARHITINSVFRTFVEDLNKGRIVCVVNEPKISFAASPSPLVYKLVGKPMNNGDKQPTS